MAGFMAVNFLAQFGMEKNGQPFRELQIPRVFLKRSKGTKFVSAGPWMWSSPSPKMAGINFDQTIPIPVGLPSGNLT